MDMPALVGLLTFDWNSSRLRCGPAALVLCTEPKASRYQSNSQRGGQNVAQGVSKISSPQPHRKMSHGTAG
jgi:hypothetical protein